MILTIDTTGNASTVLGAAPQRLERAGVLAAKRMAEDYVEAIQDWIAAGRSFTPRTGAAEQGVGWRPLPDGAEVYSQSAHATYMEFGTEPHIIRPRPGRKALRFPGSGGGMVIRRAVHHPGTKPMPFFFADQANRKRTLLQTARETFAEVLSGD